MRRIRTTTTARRAAAELVGLTVAVALITVAAGTVPTSAVESRAQTPSVAAVPNADAQPAPAALFQLSSFNVLGAGHTASGGNRAGWANGWTRMGWANELIEANGVDVIGFQELQQVQFERFEQDLGSEFDIFPGNRLSSAAQQNSIAWRTDLWRRIEARTIKVPYFDGNMLAKPYVLLRNEETGQLAWFYNTHHPADARGPAQRWRDKATAIEIDLFNSLAEEFPGVPVFATGDMNDREEVFCPLVKNTQLRAANGGSHTDGVCSPPQDMKVDWVFGSSMASFTKYAALQDKLVRKTTDHPMINTTASIPPGWSQDLPVKRVVVLDVEGLRSDAVRTLGPAGTPHLHSLISEGASTLNARTSYERTTTMPNVVSIVTGRRVSADDGGHGVTNNATTLASVHDKAGRYVSSVFDQVHDSGRSTALYTSDSRLALLDRSWGGVNGSKDRFGPDDGRDKIDKFILTAGDRGLVRRLRSALSSSAPAFTMAHLSDVARAGRQSRWMSDRYLEAVRLLDTRVGKVLATIDASASLKGSTLVLLTATNGGRAFTQRDKTALASYRVPLIATGPGVAAGTDLYALNPAYPDPGAERPGYLAAQPVRSGMVANLALAAIGLPAVPGSLLNVDQDLSAFNG